MVTNKAYNPSEVDFSSAHLLSRPLARKVLMCTPAYFEVLDVKNVHMQEFVGQTNHKKSQMQWENLKNIYKELINRKLLDEFHEIHGAEGLEDMVFAANQSFPWLMPNGEKVVMMSNMKFVSRQKEVPYFEKFFTDQGYRIMHLNTKDYFEGMGDAIPHPGKRLIYGGYGHRTEKTVFNEIAERLQVPVLMLELINARFYHLDTCFVPLDAETVALCPEAFSLESLQAIGRLFKKVIRIPAYEAEKHFSLNAHAFIPDSQDTHQQRVAILQYGSINTLDVLHQNHFEVHEIDTSEYMKSGGSVFCMKMMFY